MKRIFKCFIVICCLNFSGFSQEKLNSNNENDFVITFGSCNKQDKVNKLWQEVLKQNPDVWIWGGDIIYSDTENMNKAKKNYEKQLKQKGYLNVVNSTKVLGTWDDHDYGLNDGGQEFIKKKASQQLLLDFLGVSKTSKRREREGVYYSEEFSTRNGKVNIIVLDTRYFRTSLTKSLDGKKRYQPNNYGEGTILGKIQWEWLATTLKQSDADFNIIVSSIQVLSGEHGFETWGNFPHEVNKLINLIETSNAKGVILLSGDRHISEFSKLKKESMSYPIIDFTSSGLTHSYTSFTGENNKCRIGNVVSDVSFGVLKLNFKTKKVIFEMRGVNNVLQQKRIQQY